MACDRVVSDLMLPLWEEVLWPFSGCLGQCASTHNLYAVERPKEVRAVRRALLLPFGERADGSQGAGSAGAQHPAAWRASLPFDAEEAGLCARQQKPSTPSSRMVFLFPELKKVSLLVVFRQAT